MWRRGWILLMLATIVSLLGATLAVPAAGQQGVESPSALSNVALRQRAEQSSTAYGGTPDRAVDGDTDGRFFDGSVTHTSNGPGEWWQVDLGQTFDISEIVVWNRTDCCAERLHDVLILVSDDPFPPTAVSDPTGWHAVIHGVAGRETRIPVAASGRYVRVQHTAAEYLSLTEVEVWSAEGRVEPTPVAASGGLPTLVGVELPGGLRGGLDHVIAGGPGFIAVGTDTTKVTAPVPYILTSPDGRTWTKATMRGKAASGSITDVTEFAGGYAAIGQEPGETERVAVWLSSDGLAWQKVPTTAAFANAEARGIVSWGDSLFAIGCSEQQFGTCAPTIAWTSHDGRAWQRKAVPIDRDWSVNGFATIAHGASMVLSGNSSSQNFGAPVAAFSEDGAHWTSGKLSGSGVLWDVVMAEDGTILGVGSRDDADMNPSPLIAWTPNEKTWHDVTFEPPSNAFFGGLATDGILYGCAGAQDCAPAAWLTAPVEGASGYELSLEPVPVDPSAASAAGVIKDYVPFTEALGTDASSGGVAVGSLGADGDQPAVWLIEPGAG
jgi:hypothetical protein